MLRCTFVLPWRVSGEKLVMAEAGAKRGSDGKTPAGKRPKAGGGAPWQLGLKSAMEDPEVRVYRDDQLVIIKDKYPKARHHYLVMPLEAIPNLRSLKESHIDLLEHMEAKGQQVARKSGSTVDFRYGYHAIPSMSHVHMHVISQDFDSPSLKTKKHWNSFTSEYFIDSQDILDMLKEDGKVEVNTAQYEKILKNDLKCHRCDKKFSTIPSLKLHIVGHIPKEKKSDSDKTP